MSSIPAAGPITGGQVPLPKPRRQVRCLVAAITILTATILFTSAGSTLRPTPTVAVSPALFDATTPSTTPDATSIAPTGATRAVQAPGWLEADPYTVAAAALTDGVVAEILVLEGDSVQQGQSVARLIRVDAQLALARTEADLNAAQSVVNLAAATLNAAETDWNEPVERDRAVAINLAALARAEAQLVQLPALIQAERAIAEQLAEELDRTEQARRSGAANEIETLVARKKLEAARATVQALEQRRPILEAERDLARAELVAAQRLATLRTPERLAVEAARAEMLRANAALAQAEAARDEAALRLERTEILAPISGMVQTRLKHPGSKVMASADDPLSTHIVHIYDPARLQVRVDVPLADAAEIRVGQACEVVVEILPGRVFRGEVTRITNQADLQKNTLQIKVRLIDPPLTLKPDMLARVKFLGSDQAAARTAADDPAVLVPDAAITARDGKEAVYAVRDRRADRGRLARVPVTVLSRQDGWTSVRADLHPGDLLAIDHNLPDAARVRITRAEEPS